MESGHDHEMWPCPALPGPLRPTGRQPRYDDLRSASGRGLAAHTVRFLLVVVDALPAPCHVPDVPPRRPPPEGPNRSDVRVSVVWLTGERGEDDRTAGEVGPVDGTRPHPEAVNALSDIDLPRTACRLGVLRQRALRILPATLSS